MLATSSSTIKWNCETDPLVTNIVTDSVIPSKVPVIVFVPCKLGAQTEGIPEVICPSEISVQLLSIISTSNSLPLTSILVAFM